MNQPEEDRHVPPSPSPASRRVSRRELIQLGAASMGCAAFGAAQWHSRSNFLAKVEAGDLAYIRPPGALPEGELLRACIRCNQCADVCENDCIEFVSSGAAEGTPHIRARNKGCILCMKCNHACPTGALASIENDPDAILEQVKMGTAEVDKNICSSYNGGVCGVCVRACPYTGNALKAGMWERPIVDPEVCVGCGLCENRCIVYPAAIRVTPASKTRA